MLYDESIDKMKTWEGKNLGFHISSVSQCPNRRGCSWYVMNLFIYIYIYIYIREAEEKYSALINTAARPQQPHDLPPLP